MTTTTHPARSKPSPRQYYTLSGLHVPYIAGWSNETLLPYQATMMKGPTGLCIGYADEVSTADRKMGVLWLRKSLARGSGKAQLAAVHPLRQRRAMSHLLCQVCEETTLDDDFSRWGERHLVVLRDVEGRPVGEGEQTTAPPVHLHCAMEAIRDCPHLCDQYTAALVDYLEPWGVAGIVHNERTLEPVTGTIRDPQTNEPLTRDGDLTYVPFDSPLIHWTIAAREVVRLLGCAPVDLNNLTIR